MKKKRFPFKKNIVRLDLLLSIGFGVCMGLVFPFFASIFVTVKSPVHAFIFSAGCIVAGILVGLFAFLITKHTVLKAVSSVTNELRRFASGNGGPSDSVGDEPKDEIVRLVRWFNLLVDKLAGMIGNTKDGISYSREKSTGMAAAMNTISESMRVINDCVIALKDTYGNQEFKINAMENSLRVLDDSIVIVVSNVMEFFDQLDTLTSIVIVQSGAVDQVIANISRVLAEIGSADTRANSGESKKDSLFVTGSNLMESTINLTEKSRQNTARIRSHLDKIGDIAANINLIAINASIEAVHAGAAGKGFQVVASEIRRLSELTNRLTNDIQGVVNEIGKDTDTAVKEIGAARSAYHGILTNVTGMTTGLYKAAGNIKTVTDDVKTNYGTIGELLIGLKEKIENLKANSDFCHQALEDLKKIGEKAGESIESIDVEATDASQKNTTVLSESVDFGDRLSEMERQIAEYKMRDT